MPTKSLLQMHYWDTYYYSQVVHGVLARPASYVRGLEDFFGDLNYRTFVPAYPRWTSLHRFVEFIFYALLDESLDDTMEDSIANDPQYEPWVSAALREHGIDHTGIRPWLAQQGVNPSDITTDLLHDYHADLSAKGPLDKLVSQVAE